MGSRTWIKIYCDKWLEGTISGETPELRGIFTTLLALCGSGKYSQLGEIKVGNGIGFTDSQLATVLKVDGKVWTSAKSRLIKTNRIETTETNIIKIVNWNKYQSEYERQRPYREDGNKYTGGKYGHMVQQ